MTDSNTPLARLQKNIEQDNAEAVRKARRGVVVQGVVLVVVFAYMTFLYSQISKLNPDEFIGIIGTEAENQLPALKEAMVTHAKEIAPAATEQFKTYLLQLPDQGSEYLVNLAQQQAVHRLPQFEKQIDEALTLIITEQIATIKSESAGSPTTEDQVRRLFNETRDEFRAKMLACVDDLYTHYHRAVMDARNQMVRLASAPDLTEKEALQKEIIEVWMVLVERHRVTHPKINSGDTPTVDLLNPDDLQANHDK